MQKGRVRARFPATGEDGLEIQRHVRVAVGQRNADPRQALAHRRPVVLIVPRTPCHGYDIVPWRGVGNLALDCFGIDFERSLAVAE